MEWKGGEISYFYGLDHWILETDLPAEASRQNGDM